ncbi:recombinase family protein [Caldibacillus debilis]|uniref:hypothetical protein n=1 Tax=Caldibacillus debilis TaxID=301148 RepID=UPI00389994A2
MSVKNTERPQLQMGDIVIVHEISELSRSVKDLPEIVECLKKKEHVKINQRTMARHNE